MVKYYFITLKKWVIKRQNLILFVVLVLTPIIFIFPGYTIIENNNKRDYNINHFTITWSPDGEYLAFSVDIRINTIETEREFFYMKVSDNSVHSLGRFSFCSSSEQFSIHQCINTPISYFIGQFSNSFIFSEDGRYLSVYLSMGYGSRVNPEVYQRFNSTLLVWDLRSDKLISKYQLKDNIQDIGFQRNTIQFPSENEGINFISLNRSRNEIIYHDIENNDMNTLFSTKNICYSVQVSENRSLIPFGASENSSGIFENKNNLQIYNTITYQITHNITYNNYLLDPLDWNSDDQQLLVKASSYNDPSIIDILIWDFSENRFIHNRTIESRNSMISWTRNFEKIFYSNADLHSWRPEDNNLSILIDSRSKFGKYARINAIGPLIGFGKNVNINPEGEFISSGISDTLYINTVPDLSIRQSFTFFEYEEEIGLLLISFGFLTSLFLLFYLVSRDYQQPAVLKSNSNSITMAKKSSKIDKFPENTKPKAPLYQLPFNQNE